MASQDLGPINPCLRGAVFGGEGDTGRSANRDPNIVESVLWGPPKNAPNLGKPHINPVNLEAN